MSIFPVDDVTLAMLRESCTADEDLGRTNLFAFLDFGVDTREVVEEFISDDGAKVPVYQGGYDVPHVIVALVEEIERLRSDADNALAVWVEHRFACIPAYIDSGDGLERWHWIKPDPVPEGHPPYVDLATETEAAVMDWLLGT